MARAMLNLIRAAKRRKMPRNAWRDQRLMFQSQIEMTNRYGRVSGGVYKCVYAAGAIKWESIPLEEFCQNFRVRPWEVLLHPKDLEPRVKRPMRRRKK